MTHLNPPNAGRKALRGLSIRAYLGTCLLCRCGVYQGDQTMRGRGKLLGILHVDCVLIAEGATKTTAKGKT